MKLTIVVDNLNGGGAERIMSIMANFWAEKGWEITVITTHQGSREPFYRLVPAVSHVDLDIPGWLKIPLMWRIESVLTVLLLRRALRQSNPSVILSFLDKLSVQTLMAATGLPIPVVVSERIDPHHHELTEKWVELRNRFYPRAAKVVVQTRAGAKYFRPDVLRNTVVIPNPVIIPPNGSDAEPLPFKFGRKCLVAAGRLNPQKGFDFLLEAFQRLAFDYPDWDLYIFGEGELRPSLESQITNLGLEGRAILAGKSGRLNDVFRAADVFVLSSRYEGFPNVLCEAMASGCAVVSFACPTGPDEIIRHGVDGLLVSEVGDIDGLTEAVRTCISNDGLRKKLAENAPDVMRRFPLEVVMKMWEDILSPLSLSRKHQR
jgi:GalNAc-alpha-(1->4)-GalNAc-alpha-(1->3)-diNAcBac-PP-undecaprenol alpha-1,4-N-acetyl-D-galactosaminyltransferase